MGQIMSGIGELGIAVTHGERLVAARFVPGEEAVAYCR